MNVLAHEVSGGAGAATISVISSLVMAAVLCLLIALVFIRRARQDDAESTTDGVQTSARNGSGT